MSTIRWYQSVAGGPCRHCGALVSEHDGIFAYCREQNTHRDAPARATGEAQAGPPSDLERPAFLFNPADPVQRELLAAARGPDLPLQSGAQVASEARAWERLARAALAYAGKESSAASCLLRSEEVRRSGERGADLERQLAAAEQRAQSWASKAGLADQRRKDAENRELNLLAERDEARQRAEKAEEMLRVESHVAGELRRSLEEARGGLADLERLLTVERRVSGEREARALHAEAGWERAREEICQRTKETAAARLEASAAGAKLRDLTATKERLEFELRVLKDAVEEAVREEREACARVAKAGGCSCPRAPCDHDETGEHIAAAIRARGKAQGTVAAPSPLIREVPVTRKVRLEYLGRVVANDAGRVHWEGGALWPGSVVWITAAVDGDGERGRFRPVVIDPPGGATRWAVLTGAGLGAVVSSDHLWLEVPVDG